MSSNCYYSFFEFPVLIFLLENSPECQLYFPHLTGNEKSQVIPRLPKNNVNDSNLSLPCQCSSLISIFQTVPIAFIVSCNESTVLCVCLEIKSEGHLYIGCFPEHLSSFIISWYIIVVTHFVVIFFCMLVRIYVCL